MANKKSKFLFYMSCLLLLSAIGILFGLHFQTQPVHAVTNSTLATITFHQESDTISAKDIFEDYTQTSLKQEYKDKEVLDQLKASEQIGEEQYKRALDVLNGNVKFTQRREFSTEFDNDNKIDQVGDIAAYSQTELKCIWPASEIILTGIYGMQEEPFNIFVEANDSDKLPSVLFSQNHGYYSHWYERRQLKKGWNKLDFPSFGRKLVEEDEIFGGAIYLCNPYFPEEQGEVKVYIEGGDYYPVFRKNGNEKEFLSFLEEYENERQSKTMLDMAELVTDHTIISTTSSSLYDVYFNNSVITPTENLNLWGNYVTQLFEFNGIPTSEKSNVGRIYDPRNDYVKINFRYMTYYPGSGAYSYYNHIGWYYEHYWFANFYNAMHPINGHVLDEHLIFGMGHELGHALDNEPRKINETTNNFTAAMAYFNIVGKPHHNQYQPFEKTLKALSSDYTLNYYAYDDGQIMYRKNAYPTAYDHNYLIWWDLEAVFPGFWARFNNYFREPLKADMTTTEHYVYYSSLATGVDLSNYYERWGFYYGKSSNVSGRFIVDNASKAFKDAMREATDSHLISKRYDHFWYVDGSQYNFSVNHQNVLETDKLYKGEKPSITKIINSNIKRTVYIQGASDENHLGYEVMSKVNGVWKTAGFTYGSTFVDENYYAQNPTYKVVAINRYFYQSKESEEFSTVSAENPSVCKVGEQYFNSLHEAYETANAGQTIYLLADCKLEFIHLIKDITIEIDPTIQNDILIDANEKYFQCQSELIIKGRTNAKIIFDGNQRQATTPLIYGSSGKFVAENVVFKNMQTVYLAGVIYAQGMDAELYNCSFENCKDLKEDGTIHSAGKVKLENCTFSQIEEPCVNISNIDNLTLSKKVNKFSIIFDDFDDAKGIKLDGTFSSNILNSIQLLRPDYMLKYEVDKIAVSKLLYRLKFHDSQSSFDYELKSHQFEFGTEQHTYNMTENQYVEYKVRESDIKYKTGDKIAVENDMEFDVEIKDKLRLKVFYNNDQSVDYYPYGEEVYLPSFDKFKNKVFAYKDGDRIYSAGQIYTIKTNSTLVAVYLGNLTYRYIVKDEIYSVGYGSYGQNVRLLELEHDEFMGWKSDAQIVSGHALLKGDADFIAVFSGELPKVYDLEKCEIYIVGNYTYSGKDIRPEIVVYFNGFVVPKNCYTVSYSNNISASAQAEVSITYIDGLSTGRKTQYFTIKPKQLKLSDLQDIVLEDFVYSGSETSQNLTFSFNNENIETFSIQYIGDRTNAGKVQVKVTFSGNYLGEIYLGYYTIAKAERNGFRVSMPDWIYGENAQSPTVEDVMEYARVTYSYSPTRDSGYSSAKPRNAGTYWVKAVIDESRNYNSAEDIAQFTIAKADEPPQMPERFMTIGRKSKTLQDVNLNAKGWQWETPSMEITGENMTATAVYSDKENYKHNKIQITLTKEPRKEASLLSVDLDVKSFVYNGTERKPNVVAKDGEILLVLGEDYDVRYEDNKYAGHGKTIVSFKNDYVGSTEIAFTIEKAEKPDVSNTTIRLDHKVAKLSDVQLPNNFVWKNENMKITENRIIAEAIYTGDDASNFETTELTFEIIIEEKQQTPIEESKQGSLIWLAIGIPVAVLIIGGIIGFAAAKRKCKK